MTLVVNLVRTIPSGKFIKTGQNTVFKVKIRQFIVCGLAILIASPFSLFLCLVI